MILNTHVVVCCVLIHMIFSQHLQSKASALPPARDSSELSYIMMAAQHLKAMKPALATLQVAMKADMATFSKEHVCDYFAAKYSTFHAKQEMLNKVASLIPVPADISHVVPAGADNAIRLHLSQLALDKDATIKGRSTNLHRTPPPLPLLITPHPLLLPTTKCCCHCAFKGYPKCRMSGSGWTS